MILLPTTSWPYGRLSNGGEDEGVGRDGEWGDEVPMRRRGLLHLGLGGEGEGVEGLGRGLDFRSVIGLGLNFCLERMEGGEGLGLAFCWAGNEGEEEVVLEKKDVI